MEWMLFIEQGATFIIGTKDGTIDVENSRGFIINDGTTKDVIMSIKASKYYMYNPLVESENYFDKFFEITEEQASNLYDLISNQYNKESIPYSVHIDRDVLYLYNENTGLRSFIVIDGHMDNFLNNLKIDKYYLVNKSEYIEVSKEVLLELSNYMRLLEEKKQKILK